jgi:hypothetical protein
VAFLKMKSFEPRFQDQTFWKNRLQSLWPWELERFISKVYKDNDPIFGEVGFQLAVVDCFLSHGRYNQFISEEYHNKCLEAADSHAQLFRKAFSHEQIKAFNEYYESALRFGETFGWPSSTFELMRDEYPLNKLMVNKVNFYLMIKTVDHAHIVLNRLEDVLNKKIGQSKVHRDLYGDINRGLLSFFYEQSTISISQIENDALKVSLNSLTDSSSVSLISDLSKRLYDWYGEAYGDSLDISILTRPKDL